MSHIAEDESAAGISRRFFSLAPSNVGFVGDMLVARSLLYSRRGSSNLTTYIVLAVASLSSNLPIFRQMKGCINSNMLVK